jgi:hypothetical protein
MGMAKLNVWVTDTDDPCSISNRTWYVTIYDCDGRVLEWCGRKYVVLPARCGHLEVELPPGCYRVTAVWSFRVAGGIIYVNHFTDSAVVQACCDETTCVTLFNPSIHRCGTILVRAVRDLLLQKAIAPAIARQVENTLNELLQQLPRPIKEFELAHLDEIEKLVREQEAKEQEAHEG